jgi:hypothetical protein
MALRTWLAVITMVAALAAGYAVGRSPSRGTAKLRSGHSQPSVKVPEGLVAVATGGKTFHDPNCNYIHGPTEMITAKEAVADGYAPCVRCMRKALEK